MSADKPASVELVGFGVASHSLRRAIAGGYKPGLIWTCNDAHVHFGLKPDMIVAMDDLELDEVTHPEYVQDIVNAGCPVYASAAYAKWDYTFDYPLREVLAFLDVPDDFGGHILTNTLCYMLALAAFRGYSPINLWGFDFYRMDGTEAEKTAAAKVPVGKPKWQRYYRKPLVREQFEPGADGLNWLLGWLSRDGQSRVIAMKPTTVLDLDRPHFYYGYRKDPFTCKETAIYAPRRPRTTSSKTKESQSANIVGSSTSPKGGRRKK